MQQDSHASRVAVLGTGYWGKNLVRNFHSLDALQVVCDKNAEVVKDFQDKYPGLQGTVSYEDVLNDPGINGIAIATPAVTHADMARRALEAGKDVYVEKPLCLSEAEGVELIALAEKQDRILMVGHLLWYHPAILKLKEMIDIGRLGRIQYIYSHRLNLGKLRREENVLWSFAPHDVSVILGLLNEAPVSVWAQGGNFLNQNIADTTISILDFASGTRAHIFVSWLHPFKEQRLVVVGERAMVVFDDTAPWENKLLMYSHKIEWQGQTPIINKAEAEHIELVEAEPLQSECLHFLECMKTRKQPRTNGNEGLRVLKTLNACQKSMQENTAISLDLPTEGRV